tara:strand:+ start:225 stop:347 length:123 start_codon:yes stop_codon:yes gene_type:complete
MELAHNSSKAAQFREIICTNASNFTQTTSAKTKEIKVYAA